MRTSMRRFAAFSVVAVLALSGELAHADELLVMPYACAVHGGRPVLTPARDKGHLIAGRREQRQFSACSPVDPTLCRQWTIHRFTLDCGGVRVPWAAVATGDGAPGEWRARHVDGRVQLRMPARWVLAPDDPCARGPDFDDRSRYGRLGRYCADRMALSPPAVVDMPPGFAPMLGIDAIFVAQGQQRGPEARGVTRGEGKADASAPWTAATAEAARPKTVTAKAHSKRPPEQTEARPEPVREKSPPPKTHAAEPTAAPAADRERDGHAAGGPRIINAPVPAAREPKSTPTPEKAAPPSAAPSSASAASAVGNAQQTVEVPRPVPAVRPSERHLAFATPLRGDDEGKPVTGSITPPRTVTDTAASQPGGSPDQSRAPTAFVVDLVRAARQPAVTVATGIAALCALLLLAFAMRRQGAGSEPDAFAQRDIGAISLDGGRLDRMHTSPQPVREPPRLPPPEIPPPASTPALPPPSTSVARHQAAPSPAIIASAPPPQPKVIQTEVPRTREEALRVLGMGVGPETGDLALKKIIDGLRLTWHPDNAVDELDRLEREIRLKQINAAWEIISGKRGETRTPRRPPPLPQSEDAQSAWDTAEAPASNATPGENRSV